MKTDFNATRIALQNLQKQSLPSVTEAEEALEIAKTISDLRNAEVDRTAYVDEANSPGWKDPDLAKTFSRGREKVLIAQALADARKLLAEDYDGDPILGAALTKMPSSGLNVLKVFFEAANSPSIPSELRDNLEHKLGLDEGEADRLVNLLHDLGKPHFEAKDASHKATRTEYEALLKDFAAQLTEAVERRLGDGTLNLAAYEHMSAAFDKRIPKGRFDIDAVDPRKLEALASIALNSPPGRRSELVPLRELHRGISSLLNAILSDLLRPVPEI
jgi:hypothetical protein